MADPYRIVVGLEVHVQLLTRTKLFCGCPTKFGQPPNSQTCPVCLGLPGVLPVMNRQAFELALRAALALNCQIAPFTKWDRKQYYYPDLPKNYQISQYDLPFSHDGFLEIALKDGTVKKVGIIRAHLEEDAGKMLHDERGGGSDSLVDLNRTGTPLLEIVSQPDINSPEEAGAYLTELRLLLRELEISDCEMQEGSLRCDANVNIHLEEGGVTQKTPIVEVKNLNSISAVEKAIAYEARRHYEEARAKPHWRFGRVSKETVGWDDVARVTRLQRRKEEASDYRYFPEPDLVPVVVDAAWLDTVRAGMGEVPSAARERLQRDYGLSAYDAGVLIRQGRKVTAYFESAAKAATRPADNPTDAYKAVCNWVTNDVAAKLNESGGDIADFPLPPAALGGLVAAVRSTGLNAQNARKVFAKMVTLGAAADAEKVIAEEGLKVVGDEATLRDLVRKGIEANPKAVADFKKGKTKAADSIKGFVMKETKGMANGALLQQVLLEELGKA
jgi:aspartyl-tRNA(Asn)/glutamyl-tRNA(Gln) amidotransferase subunit B